MMSRRLTTEQLEELKALGERTLLVFDFLAREGLLFQGAEVFRKDIERAIERGDLKGIRVAWRDTCEALESMPPPKRAELETLMRSKLDVELAVDEFALQEQARAILAAGTISDEDEYRLALRHLDQMSDKEASGRAGKSIREMIEAFERQFGVPRARDSD